MNSKINLNRKMDSKKNDVHKVWKFVYSRNTSSIYAHTSKGYQTRFVEQIGRKKFTTHQLTLKNKF